MSEWRKQPPDDVGYWLRINVVDRPTITWAIKFDGVLKVMWGSNEASKYLRADHSKLRGWWWKKLELPLDVNPNVMWET